MPPPEISPAVAAPLPTTHAKRVTHASVVAAYRRMAPLYDWMFNACFRAGRRAAVQALQLRAGEQVLEVGVGTGLTLPYWPRHTRVVGIDLSPDMLARAETARIRHRRPDIELRLADAQATDFPDNHFDAVAALYVVSVVPDVAALLREMRRICRPGGRIVIVNHFAQTHPVLRCVERAAAAYASLLGFDAALPLETITKAAGLRTRRIRRVNWAGYWTLVLAENEK